MIGNFRILVIIVPFLIFSCNRKNGIIQNGNELITQNINVLLDSIEIFDISKMPVSDVSTKDFKNYRAVKTKQIKIGILDSIKIIDNNYLTINKEFLKFNLQKSNLINFKSEYKIEILKTNNYDTNILFVRFSNFNINNNKADIVVTKIVGISMVSNKYYFEKRDEIWVFKKKIMLGMG